MQNNNPLTKIDILDFTSIQSLTGYNCSTKQAKCLSEHKIYYITGKDGKIYTTSKWLEQAPYSNHFATNDKVNLDF